MQNSSGKLWAVGMANLREWICVLQAVEPQRQDYLRPLELSFYNVPWMLDVEI
jgi:hypothetical protein